MRISGGKHLNRKIATKTKVNKNVEYRPTSDRSRQAVFNIITNSPKLPEDLLNGALVVDICCGCGSFSLEALSRGASEVMMIDNSKEQLDLAKHNAEHLGELENCRFLKADATQLPKIGRKADIVFADPPYYDEIEVDVLNSMLKSDILGADTIVILEIRSKFSVDKIQGFEVFIEREYGKTKLLFMKIK